MPLPSERDSRLYVEDMLRFCDTVLDYTLGLDQASFAADRMRLDATLRNLALIGEAATRVPADIRALAPNLPWRKVVGTPQPLEPRLPGHRQRHGLEHCGWRRASVAHGAACLAAGHSGLMGRAAQGWRRNSPASVYPSKRR